MIREELLALAYELEGMDCREGCRTCPADGTKDCRGDLSCEEAVARVASRRIREVVEHDECEGTTVSAYDLLSDEDREAIAWVREHGGLDAVKKRLMPEGMEWLLDVWPRWSNGEYCKFGDWWKAGEYGEREPRQLSRLAFFTPEQLREWGQDEGENFGYEWNFMRPSDTTYRPDKVEPPAPKVLDADGVLCREGDEVWEVRSHRRREIVGTHYRDYETGEPLILCDGDDAIPIPATCVTHTKPEPPDTWERLEHDAEKTVCEYFGANYDCADCPLEPARCVEEAKIDVIKEIGAMRKTRSSNSVRSAIKRGKSAFKWGRLMDLTTNAALEGGAE